MPSPSHATGAPDPLEQWERGAHAGARRLIYGMLAGAQIFYAGSVVVTGVVKLILWWYAAHNRRLLEPETTDAQIRAVTMRGFVTPAVFLISIPFALVHPAIPIVLWISTAMIYGLARLLFRR